MEASITNDGLVWKCIARLLEIANRAPYQELESKEKSTPTLQETFPIALPAHLHRRYRFARIRESDITTKH